METKHRNTRLSSVLIDFVLAPMILSAEMALIGIFGETVSFVVLATFITLSIYAWTRTKVAPDRWSRQHGIHSANGTNSEYKIKDLK